MKARSRLPYIKPNGRSNFRCPSRIARRIGDFLLTRIVSKQKKSFLLLENLLKPRGIISGVRKGG